MKLLHKLLEPVPFNLDLANRLAVPPEKVRAYVSDPGTLDKYCPGLHDTTVTQDHYRSTMDFLGVGWTADMDYHRTEDGVQLHGTWKGPVLPAFGETLTLQVKPDGDGSELVKHERYVFPRFLAPTFPFLRWSLTRVSHQSCQKLEGLLQGRPPQEGRLAQLRHFVSGSARTMAKAGVPAAREMVSQALQSPISDADFKARYGPWAVVTGATGGMGSEFARQLADKGVNVVLVARSQDRLEALARELPGVQTRVLPMDLSATDAAEQLDTKTRDLDVGLLVNTAGGFQTGPFLKQSIDDQARLVDFNVKTPLALAHHFGQRLADRHRGGIMLMSAGSAFQGVPTVANYAASKAYVLSLAEGLAAEMRPAGVDVLAVCPGPTPEPGPEPNSVTSQGVDWSRSAVPTTSPAQVAKESLAALGRQSFVIPGAWNRAAFAVQSHTPRQLNTALAGQAVAELQGYESVADEMASR